jgi:benzoyl-CoA reductase/2-hydroxyglutaryl-CoA dehydratase subunit BcrC/BadD/HgdB
MTEPRRITLAEWDERYAQLLRAGLREPEYGGPLRRHIEDGDLRLAKLRLDNSAAALRLWNFLLSEEERLRRAQAEGKKLVGVMKDLGTVPVMACSFENLVAFYPDGAWWIPCIMERSARLLEVADSLGVDDSFCPVRAMLGAFQTEAHFPIPGLLTCSVGATCDDLSAIAQRLEGMGHPIVWWEIPHRRDPDRHETPVSLPGGFQAPACQVALVMTELARVRGELENYAGGRLTDEQLATGIRRANRVRRTLDRLRSMVYGADACPLPALEMLIAEMLAIHYCSDQGETIEVLEQLHDEAQRRVEAGDAVLPPDAVRTFWVNPVADLRAMNLLEDAGGRICGTEYLFCHALDLIPEDLPPMQALAQMAMADPMVGSAADRAERICDDIGRYKAEAVVISCIPGASHCAMEGPIIGDIVRSRTGLPVAEIEVPPVADSVEPSLRTRLEALVETVRERRRT